MRGTWSITSSNCGQLGPNLAIQTPKFGQSNLVTLNIAALAPIGKWIEFMKDQKGAHLIHPMGVLAPQIKAQVILIKFGS